MDVDRFRKVCGLLGSEHAGERASAALKASEMLKAAGATWGQIEIGKQVSPFAVDTSALTQYWQMMYKGEREQSERRAKDIQKLKREVARLKSMWPNGEPPKRKPPAPKPVEAAPPPEQESMIDYDRMLRERVAEALADAAAGNVRMSSRSVDFLRSVSMHVHWSDRQREAVEKTLRWFYADKT